MADPRDVVQRHVEAYLRETGSPTDIMPELEQLTPAELAGLLPGLHSTGGVGAHHEALRDTINAVLYRKMTTSLIESIRALDRSTQRLTIAGWAITIVVGIVGVVVPVLATMKCGR